MIALQDAARSTAEVRLPLWGDYALADPWFLALAPVVALAAWWGRGSRRHAPARLALVPGAEVRLAPGVAQRLAWVPTVARALALLLVVVALARPLRGRVEFSSTSEGIDIALLLDRSDSMTRRFEIGGSTRFEIAKEVLGDFAERRTTDRDGAADSVALFGFAAYSELLVPFTRDTEALSSVLDEVEFETERDLNSTAIGVALAQAVEVLRRSDAESRVAVLLTDGQNNVEVILPMEAAEMAAESGVRVYTVFAGPKEFTRTDPLTGRRMVVTTNVGELPAIAEATGGRFFHATSQAELEEAYRTIEELERTPREERRYAERYDLYPRVVWAALALYALGWLGSATWGRRLP